MRTVLRSVLPVTAIVLYPAAAVWLFFQDNWYSIFHSYSLAMVFGLLCYCYLSLSLLLGARLKALDLVFGHDRVILFHGCIATSGIVFAILHAILKFQYYPEITGQSLLGIIGLALFTFVLLVTVTLMLHTPLDRIPLIAPVMSFVKKHFYIDYTVLKAVHNITAPAFILAIIHVMLAYPVQETPGRIVFFGISGSFAILFYLYHKALRPLRALARAHRVSQVRRLSTEIVEITTVPKNGKPFKHKAGQFAFFRFLNHDAGYGEHPFTISSSPSSGNLCITVKNLGNYTASLGTLAQETTCLIDGPYGLFFPGNAHSEILCIAGGIGITPFLSILDDLAERDPQRKISLIWSVRFKEEAFAKERLESLQTGMPGFTFRILVTGENSFNRDKPDNRIDAGILREAVQSFNRISSSEAFICGSSFFRKTLQQQLIEIGIKRKNIHYESFSF